MKRFNVFAVLCALAWAGPIVLPADQLLAQDKGFGAGVIAGSPTGLSGKFWISQENAVDVGLAWSFEDDGYFHIHADYLWHFPHVIRSSQRFVLYGGLGGRLGLSDNTRVGVRIPGGIEWWPRNTPLDVFAEVVPVLDLAPKTKFSFNGGVGIRFFFD